ncbi:hypothetical protein SLEP1_g20070 [Rubroshorea leprosula]|uniref:Inhibitor I9 domain-containing protein n=1 Tax=Rubroshorea leprosula TaxID=152421 RepID=A0AAV5JAH7_9ROSI|nr:hypothetical protein SLEP1_g20070 [Rubroshorea leprosula]
MEYFQKPVEWIPGLWQFAIPGVLAVRTSYFIFFSSHFTKLSNKNNLLLTNLRINNDDSFHSSTLLSYSQSHFCHPKGVFILFKTHSGAEIARDKIFYSYTHSINGFAAVLDEEEAVQLAKRLDVISVFPNKPRKLHTTHSWEFLRLKRDGIIPSEAIWKKARFGKDTITGNLDTGVWPESRSFSDEGYGPVPSRWRGVCQSGNGDKFHCSRSILYTALLSLCTRMPSVRLRVISLSSDLFSYN